jgi:hypothetical protein
MFRKISLAALLVVALQTATQAEEERGTFIHVKNGTNKTLKFDLYIHCAGAGLGKFDNPKEVAPGQVVVWRLPAGRTVATQVKDGQTFHGVGLVGADANGKSIAWGLVGGTGMVAKERANAAGKHILVQPIGQL